MSRHGRGYDNDRHPSDRLPLRVHLADRDAGRPAVHLRLSSRQGPDLVYHPAGRLRHRLHIRRHGFVQLTADLRAELLLVRDSLAADVQDGEPVHHHAVCLG